MTKRVDHVGVECSGDGCNNTFTGAKVGEGWGLIQLHVDGLTMRGAKAQLCPVCLDAGELVIVSKEQLRFLGRQMADAAKAKEE